MESRLNIAIDGPSGAGKSSVAKGVAKKLNIIYVDTGAMYRAVGLYMFRHGIDPQNAEAVAAALSDVHVELSYSEAGQRVYLNGEDVSEAIRENTISMYASHVSAIPAVRAFLLDLQRDMAKKHDVVMDGRDIGTVILPDANVKIFMTASVESRADRRYKELLARGASVDYEEILSDIRVRDDNDRNRAIAPAVAAEDAVLFDNTEYDLDASIAYVLKIIKEKIAK